MIPSVNQIPPVPEDFEDKFTCDGWKGVERAYGASTALLLEWIERSGGEELYRKHREHARVRRADQHGHGPYPLDKVEADD